MSSSNLTQEQIEVVREHYDVYLNDGTGETGQWVYQPHYFDSTFELWSDGYDTEQEAYAAAYAELMSGGLWDGE